MKKSQGLSLNTVVIAAMVILVLIVVVVIVIRYTGGFAQNVGSCETTGGVCAEEFYSQYGDDKIFINGKEVSRTSLVPRPDLNCASDTEKCYIVLGN